MTARNQPDGLVITGHCYDCNFWMMMLDSHDFDIPWSFGECLNENSPDYGHLVESGHPACSLRKGDDND